MVDKPLPPHSPGDRLRTLAPAALNADATVEQLDTLVTTMDKTLMGMGGTMEYFEKMLIVMNTTMTPCR